MSRRASFSEFISKRHDSAAAALAKGGGVLVICTCFVAGCANLSSIAPPVTPAMVAASGGSNTETLESGRRIYTDQCTACHSAEPVVNHGPAEWRRIVADMGQRSRLNRDQESALIAYILAAPRGVASQPAR